MFTPIPQTVPTSCVCEFVATHAPGYVTIVGAVTPVDCLKPTSAKLVVYFEESAKKLSSALTRLRRSDFMAVTYAYDFVFANFGIAIAARMPMMTTTINSSISVKPFRFIDSPGGWMLRAVEPYKGTYRASTYQLFKLKRHNTLRLH